MAESDKVVESDDSKYQELCAQVVADMERLHVPGAVVGVLFEGREQIQGFGVTHVDHPLPVDAHQHCFRSAPSPRRLWAP